MAKRKLSDTDDSDDSPIKKMCTNGNLIRVKSDVLSILRQGARKLWSLDNSPEKMEVQTVKCRICQRKLTPTSNLETIKCNFCEHSICHSCLVNCGQCGHQFCSFCAVNGYSPVGDMGTCLTCF